MKKTRRKWAEYYDLPEIKKIRKAILDTYSNKLQFIEETHQNFLDGIEYTCVSDIVKRWENNDREAMLEGCAKKAKWKKDYKYYGMTKDEIRELWDKSAKEACDFGTLVHGFGESMFYWMIGEDDKILPEYKVELKEMHKELGITFIYVTHDQEEALTLSDTIVVMNEGKIQQIGTPIDIYNEPVNCFVADFIGESNILKGKMMRDRRVAFIKHEFDCVDEGFGEMVPVDVVVRPEDIYFTTDPAKCQFKATVNSCTFKGVHYEMWVDTDTGYELMIQDYDPDRKSTRLNSSHP